MLERNSLNCLEEIIGINTDLKGESSESSERSENYRESFITIENIRIAMNRMLLEISASKVLLVSPQTAIRNTLLDSGENIILVIKQQSIWLTYTLPLGGK